MGVTEKIIRNQQENKSWFVVTEKRQVRSTHVHYTLDIINPQGQVNTFIFDTKNQAIGAFDFAIVLAEEKIL